MLEQLRKLHASRPFQPFVIHTSDGREFPVESAAHVYFPPSGTSIVWAASDGTVELVAVEHVTSAAVHTERDRPGRRGGEQ